MEVVIFDIIGTANSITEVFKDLKINISDFFNPNFNHLIDQTIDKNVHIEDLGLEVDKNSLELISSKERDTNRRFDFIRDKLSQSTKNFITMERGMYPGKYELAWKSA